MSETCTSVSLMLDPPCYTIRRASIEDSESIARIWAEGIESSFGSVPITTIDRVQDFFNEQLLASTHPYGYWVVEVNGKIAGWQSLLFCQPSPVSKWAYSSTYISCHNRTKGLGRALLTFATEHAISSDISHIEGVIRLGNEPVTRIANSLGWKLVGNIPEADHEPHEAIYVFPCPHQDARGVR